MNWGKGVGELENVPAIAPFPHSSAAIAQSFGEDERKRG